MECPICFEPMHDAVALQCMHSLCNTCATTLRKKSMRCPVCREISLWVKPNYALRSVIQSLNQKSTHSVWKKIFKPMFTRRIKYLNKFKLS